MFSTRPIVEYLCSCAHPVRHVATRKPLSSRHASVDTAVQTEAIDRPYYVLYYGCVICPVTKEFSYRKLTLWTPLSETLKSSIFSLLSMLFIRFCLSQKLIVPFKAVGIKCENAE